MSYKFCLLKKLYGTDFGKNQISTGGNESLSLEVDFNKYIALEINFLMKFKKIQPRVVIEIGKQRKT